MKERVLIFQTEEEAKVFAEALEKATLGKAEIRPDLGWPKPALRVRAQLAQILAASIWAGFEPAIV